MVKDLQKGDIVGVGPLRHNCGYCEKCKAGEDNLCITLQSAEKDIYVFNFGGWASHLQFPCHHVFKLPAGLDLATTPPIMCAGVTVFSPLNRYFKELGKGAHCGIMGIGGLGHLAIQYAKALGYNVTALTQYDDKIELCKQLGASNVIVVDSKFNELKKHEGRFDIIINTIPASGNSFFDSYMTTVRRGGIFVQIGVPNVKEQINPSFFTLVSNQIRLVGSFIGAINETKETLQFTADHKIKVMAEMFAFEDFPKALKRLEHEKPHFRCIVDCKSFVEKNFEAPEGKYTPTCSHPADCKKEESK